MAKVKKEFLTKEQLIEKMGESREKLNSLVSEFNAAESATDATKLDKAIKDEKKQYNEYAQSLALTECLASENPTAKACEVSVYTSIITKSTVSESGIKTIAVEEKHDTLLDLTRFTDGVTNPWRYKAQLLCLFYTKESASSINKTTKEYMADLEKFFKLSDEARKAQKASKRSLTTAIKEVVSAMIGEKYGNMVVAYDVNKFIAGFTSDDKNTRDTIKTANYTQTVKLLTDICHRILTDGQYRIYTKQLSKEGKEWQAKQSIAKPAASTDIEVVPADTVPEVETK